MLLAVLLVQSQASAAPAQDVHPGYGVVESVVLIRPEDRESASAGASRAPLAQRPRYVVRVRLDDGSLQVREARRKVAKGARVLLTNAGDVVPE